MQWDSRYTCQFIIYYIFFSVNFIDWDSSFKSFISNFVQWPTVGIRLPSESAITFDSFLSCFSNLISEWTMVLMNMTFRMMCCGWTLNILMERSKSLTH